MLRLHKDALKPNKHPLRAIADRNYWMSLTMADMYKHLSKPIIHINCITALPDHENIIELLQSVAAKLKSIDGPGMEMFCIRLLLNQASHLPTAFDTAEQFMKCKAMVNYHLGHFKEASKYAGVLGLKYFCLHRDEYDKDCSHFNIIAGICYEQCGNIEKACLHYNYFVFTGRHESDPSSMEELIHALTFLIQHKALIITPDIRGQLIEILDEEVGDWNEEVTNIIDAIRLIPDRYDSTYYESEIANAQNNLRSDMQYIVVRGARGQKTWGDFFKLAKDVTSEDDQKIKTYVSYYDYTRNGK